MPLVDRDKVRVLCGDTVSPQKLTDDQIDYFLSDNSSDIKLAAADALDALAALAAHDAKSTKTMQTQTDLRSISEQFRKQAKALRDSVQDEPAIAVAEQSHADFAAAQIICNQAARTS